MSLYPSLNNNYTSNNSKINNILFPARVKNILLNNDDILFKKKNGWGDIGLIEFKTLYKNIDTDKSFLTAKPLFPNIKNFPLKEEIVIIINGPTDGLNTNDNSSGYYYIPFPINIWNNIHHNAFPNISTYNSLKKEIELGNTFTEQNNIKNLLPEEGDTILEGRYGNSIRFSHTTPNKKNNNNSWSSKGDSKDPILVISNNHNRNVQNEPWVPTQEDINEDGSGIWLCSNQEIPINYSCKNMQSFDITISDSFNIALELPSNEF